MSARHRAGLAALALWAALAQAAEPPAASRPAMRTVNTPAGPVYELAFPSTSMPAASAPAADVQSPPAGPMLVLRKPMASVSSLRRPSTSAFPANVQTQALPNGAQMLVLPNREAPAAASTAPPAIVEIDPARLGTRLEDTPRNDVLYRPKPTAAAASR